MVSKKHSSSATLSAFANLGRDKAHQQTASRIAFQSQKPLLNNAEAKRRFVDAKCRLKNEPVGSAVRLNTSVFLKKTGQNKYEISSLQ